VKENLPEDKPILQVVKNTSAKEEQQDIASRLFVQ
jgi:hypothetical protein